MRKRERLISPLWTPDQIRLSQDGELPTRFRLFKAGENATSKGTFLFDEAAAAAVMDRYAAEGVDLMIDLEHLSLDQESENYDPDARGWCRLTLENGELWAVDVKWTPDGAARLNEKRQRYVSPVFEYDSETSQIQSVLNVAIVGMPATHATPALVAAARRRASLSELSFENRRDLVNGALEQLFGQYDAWVCDLYDTTFVYEHDGKYWRQGYTINNGQVTISSEPPIQVVRAYVPVQAMGRLRALTYLQRVRNGS